MSEDVVATRAGENRPDAFHQRRLDQIRATAPTGRLAAVPSVVQPYRTNKTSVTKLSHAMHNRYGVMVAASGNNPNPVSYTHLTLPTIYSV